MVDERKSVHIQDTVDDERISVHIQDTVDDVTNVGGEHVTSCSGSQRGVKREKGKLQETREKW